MNREDWETRIISQCREAGTYREYFADPIKTLAAVLEKRDTAEEEFQASGGVAVVRHTNKAGATNAAKNPMLIIINDLNAQALAFWRDLGLTPAGLKKLNEKAMQPKKVNSLAEVLKELGG